MAEYTVTIKGAEDVFKDLDVSIKKLNENLEKLEKGTKRADKGFDAFGKAGSKLAKGQKVAAKVMGGATKILASQGQAVGALSIGMLKAVPAVGAFAVSIGALGKLVNAMYQTFLTQNKLMEQTGDVFASVDISAGNLSESMHKMRGELIATSFATLGGTATVKDHLAALRGYTQAGLVVSDLKERFNLLADATTKSITYATLFTMKIDEMGAVMGNFVRELNLGAKTTDKTFNALFKSAVDARYGTRNFLNIVNQTVPTIGYFGGSIDAVGRSLQFMGRTGVISMQQAGKAVKFLTVGVKEMGWEQQTVLAALVSQDTMLKLGRRRLAQIVEQQEIAKKGSDEWNALQIQRTRLEIDLARTARGSTLAMGRMLEQLGPGAAIEIMFEAMGKIPGKQLKTLEDLVGISREQEIGILGVMKQFGMGIKELRVMQKMGVGQTKTSDGLLLETAADIGEAVDLGKLATLEQLAKTPEEIAEEYRKLTQDLIGVTLDNIFNLLVNQFWPLFEIIADGVINFASAIAKKFGVDSVERLGIIRELLKQGFDYQKLSAEKSLTKLKALNETAGTLEDSSAEETKELQYMAEDLEAQKFLAMEAADYTKRLDPDDLSIMKQILGNIADYNKVSAEVAEYGKDLPPLPPELVKVLGDFEKTLAEYRKERAAAGLHVAPVLDLAKALKEAKAGITQNITTNISDSSTPLERTADMFKGVAERQRRVAEKGIGG